MLGRGWCWRVLICVKSPAAELSSVQAGSAGPQSVTLPVPVSSCREPCDSKDLELRRIFVHHHRSQAPSAGSETWERVGGGGGNRLTVSHHCTHPSSPHHPFCLWPFSREATLSLSQPPDGFCSCEQTNGVGPLTRENASARLISLPRGAARLKGQWLENYSAVHIVSLDRLSLRLNGQLYIFRTTAINIRAIVWVSHLWLRHVWRQMKGELTCPVRNWQRWQKYFLSALKYKTFVEKRVVGGEVLMQLKLKWKSTDGEYSSVQKSKLKRAFLPWVLGNSYAIGATCSTNFAHVVNCVTMLKC